MSDEWRPRRELPEDLAWPCRIDPDGVSGPTRGEAQARGWRRCGSGWVVPSSADPTRAEQRILEAGIRLRQYEALTGWASLRWHGAGFFDGRSPSGVAHPVPVIRRSGARNPDDGLVVYRREQLAPSDATVVAGLRCAAVPRALFDEMRFAASVRDAVVSLDMVAAAGLTTVAAMREYVEQRPAWAGVRQVRKALDLAVDSSRSPQESRLRLVWVLDAGLPEPVCNVPVFHRDGTLLGVPDLFDAEVGLVVEYDGAHHKDADRHRRDVAREHRFREAGLEYAAVVGGDLARRALVVDRLLAAYRRARGRPASSFSWTLVPPPWWTHPAA
jgi:hypothetical protein